MINTPHINPKGKIAKTVLMPGDPLRAKYIAENFLEDYELINDVRGMLGYTGKYQGKEVSVMGSGMGMPSIGIYSYELFNFYNVDNIIRIGSAGAYTDELNLYDVVLVSECYSNSTYALNLNGDKAEIQKASKKLNEHIKKVSEAKNFKVKYGKIHSSDVFYGQDHDAYKKLYQDHGCLCVEMESFALFANARLLNKEAACLLTISDSLATGEKTTALERQTAFNEMVKLALESVE